MAHQRWRSGETNQDLDSSVGLLASGPTYSCALGPKRVEREDWIEKVFEEQIMAKEKNYFWQKKKKLKLNMDP